MPIPPPPVASEAAPPRPKGEIALNGDAPDGDASIWKRVLSPQTAISFALALAVLWFVMRRLDVNPQALWGEIRHANPLYLAVAFALWYGSFFVRGWRWGRMIHTAGLDEGEGRRKLPVPELAQIVLLAYFANSLAPAKLGDAFRAYLLRREGGVPMSAGFGTILAERLADAMMIVVVLAVTAFLVFGGQLPEEASPTLKLAALLLVVGAAGLVLMWVSRDMILRILPHRFRETYTRLQGAVFGSLRNPPLVFGVGLLLWLGDGMRVWFVARSIDAGISPAVAILVAVMGALLTIIPFTPAGLGVVELGVGSVLVGVLGLEPVVAGSIILLDRVVAYWSLLLVGACLYIWRTRRELRGRGQATVSSPTS